MSDKKKKRKSDKGENEKKDKENDDWKELLTRAKLSDIPCSCLVSILSESNQEQNTYINILCDGSHVSLRRSMKILSKMEMIKNIFQAEIFRASSRTPKYFQVCEEALNIVKGGSKISTELWILLIKFHILYFIEEYILQKEREELKTFTDSNSQLNETISEVKELEKRGKKNTAVKKNVSSLKLNSLLKEADGTPVQQKPHSKIRHKNEEWKDIPYIDDAPPDGPDIYFILVDFHDTDVLEGLAEAGIPFLCFIKLFSEIRSSGSEKKSKIDYSKKQTVLRKPMNKSDKKQKNKIHEVEELTFEEQELAINTFWEIVENRKENTRRKFSFDDLPIVPFKLPDLPLDEQMHSEIGQTIYHRLSFLIYDIYCLKMKYLNYLQKMKIRLKNSNDYAICTEEINIYNSLMDKIPAEAVTVPLILTCMLEGVVNGGERISMNSSSFYLTHGKNNPIQLMKTLVPEIDMKYGTTNKPKERAKLNFPRIINFGDELLMKMYQYLDCTADAVRVPYNLLQQNPISIMWNRYPSLPYCEKIFYAYHLRKFTKSIENEIFDYNVVFYLFCLLKFEEMLKEISKMNLKIKEEPSSPISTMMPQYVIVTNDQSIFMTLKQMDNLVSLSEAVGYKVMDLDDIQNENMPNENYSKQFCLRKRNVKITLSDKDCVGIFKANTDMGVESKGNEKSCKRNSIGERNSNTTLSEEEINFSTEFTVENLSESQPFHCNEIEDLFSNKDSSNLFKITKRYGFVEQLNEQVFSQVLHSCLLKFNKFKHFYFKPCDVILVLFYNPHDIERIHKHKWSAKIPSPVSFRNFYDSVMYEEIDRLSEEKQPYDELVRSSDQVDTSRNMNINKDLGNMLFSECKDEFLLEDSIKYYESIHLHKTLDVNDIKSVKENSSKHNILNKEIEKENFGKPDTETSISSTGKITKEISNNEIIKEWNATDIHGKPSVSSEDCEESFLEGYDLGSERVEIFGEDTKFISSNGKMMVSVKSLLQHGRQKIISIEIEQDKNSMFYHVEHTNESKIVSCNNKEKVLTFHVILRNGVIIAFENTVDIHGNSSIIKKQKESKESINKEEEIETVKVEGMMKMHKHSKPTFDMSLKSLISKDPSNDCDNGLERKAERKADDLKCLHVCGFDMTLSLPNGLTVEKKLSNGFPFYVKQKYVSKGRHSATNEEFRLYLSNGNILKFMINGEVIILCPNSTVYVCKTFKKCEESTEKESTENLEDEIKISNNISADHYTILLPSGKSYEKICGKFHDQPSLALRYATDMEDEKVYISRGDGTCSILQPEGHLIVNFPDKSCISTFLNVLEEDFLSDIVWEEGDLSAYFFDSDTSQNCDNSKEKSSQIIIGKPVVEESYVVIYLNHHFEHPYFSSVYFDGLHESAMITIPQNTVINITKDGKYHLNVHNSIELEVMDSHAKFIYGNAESTLYFQNESDIPDKELLCTNNDGLGNMFNIKLDGTTNICRSVGRDSVEEEGHCKMRLLVVKRDNSGAEFHERRDIDSYLAEAKSNAKVSVVKHLECDVTEEQQSQFFTIFSPLTEFEKNNWLMPVENSVDAIQCASSNVVRSTYWVDNEGKPASFWFNPFPKSKKRNEGYQRNQQWNESMGDVLCFRVFRQLSSLGVSHGRFSLANVMHKAFQKYKNDTDRIHIQEIDGSKIQDKYFSEDDPENPEMESKILKEKKWFENSKSLVWNANVEASFIEGLLNKANKTTEVKHNLVRNEEKRLKKLQRLREAAKKEQEDWMKLRNKVILPYHTLYLEQFPVCEKF